MTKQKTVSGVSFFHSDNMESILGVPELQGDSFLSCCTDDTSEQLSVLNCQRLDKTKWLQINFFV